MTRSSSCVRIVLETFLLYIIVVQDAVPSAVGRGADQYQGLSPNQGLYNASDKVVVLNVTNFRSNVYGSPHGWLVEFYNSWCGFCQRFAPTWKALARNILTWRDIVAVAAINCADDDNTPLCREYEIMRYPEVRYFPPNENSGTLGVDVEKGKDMDTLRQSLIARLQKEQQEGRGTNWPNITPYRSSEITNVWEGTPDAVKYFFFIFEDPQSYLGSEVILDLHNVTSLQMRRVSSDNNLLCIMHKVTRFPSIIVFARDGSQERLSVHIPTREGTRNVIKNFMSAKGITIDVSDIPDEHPGEWLKADVPMSPVQVQKLTTESKRDSETKTSQEDLLYQADLEAALRYSFKFEIPMRKAIEGERMKALKNYTEVLASYFPMERGNPMFLNEINRVVRSKENMTSAEFRALRATTEEKMSTVYAEKNEWIGCRGSTRGYPCGLWTIFHTLTVNFAIKNNENPEIEPTQVLQAIHGYVKHFFTCGECSQHFQTMASANRIFDVRTVNESVLWLWSAHNEVNARLADKDSEESTHKKIQYPSAKHCPSCRNGNGDWNHTEVLTYLKRKYSYSGIQYVNSIVSPMDLDRRSDDDKPKLRQERLAVIPKNVSRKTGWDFTIFDISICVVLYVASAAILILVCVKFAVKRSYKKKMYIHSLLGKV